MGFTTWRGTVGLIKPTRRPGSLEEFIRLLPEGIGVIPLLLNAQRGTPEEFERGISEIGQKVRELAEAGVDVVHQQGGGMMLRGLGGEREIVAGLEQAHGVPVVTSGMVQIEAMQALQVRSILSVTRSAQGSRSNGAVEQYFSDAGLEVVAVEGMDVPFESLGQFSDRTFYAKTKAAFLRAGGADAIHIVGGGWRVLGIVKELESDLGVPVIHTIAAGVWAMQQRLAVRQQVMGYGRLLAEMPRAKQ